MNDQIVTSRSDADLGRGFGDVKGKGQIYISMRWVNLKLETSDESLNGKVERRLMIIKQPVGDTSTASSKYITPQQAEQMYPEEWRHFNETGDMPLNGTALSELPGISVSQIQMLNLAGFRSVEDIAGAQEHIVNQLGHEGRFVHGVATDWLAKAKENADLTEISEVRIALENQNRAEKARADKAEADMAAMRAELAGMRQILNANTGAVNLPQPTMPGGGEQQMIGYDSGPAIEETPNPLDSGDGYMEDEEPFDINA